MRLAEYTDYTLRVLMYCAARPRQLVTIGELAEHHALSKNHLMKIVNDLARQGVIATTRGRGGGLRLLKDPADIRVGDVVRALGLTKSTVYYWFTGQRDVSKHLREPVLTYYRSLLPPG